MRPGSASPAPAPRVSVGAQFGPGDLVAVTVPAPLPGPLDYAVPDGMALAPGDFVEVSLGPRRMVGVVWGPGQGAAPRARVKTVSRRLEVPAMGAAMRGFLDRAAAYTLTEPCEKRTRIPPTPVIQQQQVAKTDMLKGRKVMSGRGNAPASLGRLSCVFSNPGLEGAFRDNCALQHLLSGPTGSVASLEGTLNRRLIPVY